MSSLENPWRHADGRCRLRRAAGFTNCHHDWENVFLRAAVDFQKLQFKRVAGRKKLAKYRAGFGCVKTFRRLRHGLAFHRRDGRALCAGPERCQACRRILIISVTNHCDMSRGFLIFFQPARRVVLAGFVLLAFPAAAIRRSKKPRSHAIFRR